MPTYSFSNKNSSEIFDMFLSISEREDYLKNNPHIEQLISAPAIVSGISKKPDAGFRDILKNIKKKHSQGLTRSTVNTF